MTDNEFQISANIKRVVFTNYEQGMTGCLLADCKVTNGKLPRGFEEKELDKLFYMAPIDHAYEGVELNMTGKLIKAGPRFKFITSQCIASLPRHLDHIRNYISSGAIQYLGPNAAKLFVDKYGAETLTILDENPKKVHEDFRNEYSLGQITAATNSWKVSRQNQMNIKIFDDLDLTRKERSIIVQDLKDRTHEQLTENPYQAGYYTGIDFRKIDSQIQSNKNKFSKVISRGNRERFTAAFIHVLNDAESEGHTGVHLKTLVDKAIGHVGFVEPETMIKDGLRPLIKKDVLSVIEQNGSMIVQKQSWDRLETEFCSRLQVLLDARPKVNSVGFLPITNSKHGLGSDQYRAVKLALNNHFTIITGGPGTGKTTTVNSVILSLNEVYRHQGVKPPKILGIAPSGLAAQRMNEATGMIAMTCHGALGVQPGGELLRKPGRYIDADVLILDEMTMNPMIVMLSLMRAIRPGTRVIMLGDVDQLPSVEAGNVYADLINSNRLPVGRLNETFRYSEQSRVYDIAQNVKHGVIPEILEEGDDWRFVQEPNSQLASRGVIQQFRDYIEQGISPYDIQIIAPLHNDFNGTKNLNRLVQQEMNSMNPRRSIDVGEMRLQEGDLVMNLQKDDRYGLANGQNGIIIHATKNFVSVDYDGREMVYYEGDFHKVTPAWAKTVHKTQGSEYKNVIAPVAMDNKAFYSWQLLYTGLTRMKSHITYVGDPDVFRHSVNHMRDVVRVTGLCSKIQEKVSPVPKDLRALVNRSQVTPSLK